MAEMLINNWGGGIGDDPFLSRPGECLDMDGIDIRTTPRKISADRHFLVTYASQTSGSGSTMNYATETIDGVVQSYGNKCYIDTTDISGLVAGADLHITVGSNLDNYDSTTNPEGVRHIFFTYNNSTNQIITVGYAGGVRALIGSAVNTSGGASPANIPAIYRTTAVCYLWKGAIIFARGSKIYEFNPEATTLATGPKVELPVGAVVKYITYQGGLINFVYTINNDTYIHGCTYDGTNYKLYPYADKTVGEKCLSAVVNGGLIYWISTSGIFIYNGSSQLVRKYTFSTNALCSYNKGVLKIVDGSNYFEYGIQKPNYGSPLTRTSISTLVFRGITENNVITYDNSSIYRLDFLRNSTYKASNTWTFHPYTAGQFGIEKKGLGIRVGYSLPRDTYTDSAVQCSITVAIQTYDMFATNSTTFVTIATITDKTKTNKEIMFTEIAKALGDAGWSEEFEYFRLRLTLNTGDGYAGVGGTLFRKTPEVYDVYITHEEIKQSF